MRGGSADIIFSDEKDAGTDWAGCHVRYLSSRSELNFKFNTIHPLEKIREVDSTRIDALRSADARDVLFSVQSARKDDVVFVIVDGDIPSLAINGDQRPTPNAQRPTPRQRPNLNSTMMTDHDVTAASPKNPSARSAEEGGTIVNTDVSGLGSPRKRTRDDVAADDNEGTAKNPNTDSVVTAKKSKHDDDGGDSFRGDDGKKIASAVEGATNAQNKKDCKNEVKDGDVAADDASDNESVEEDEKSDSSILPQQPSTILIRGVTGIDAVDFPVSNLRNHLICPLCKGYFRDPYTVADCLHSFCRSCLILTFRLGHRRCPTW